MKDAHTMGPAMMAAGLAVVLAAASASDTGAPLLATASFAAAGALLMMAGQHISEYGTMP